MARRRMIDPSFWDDEDVGVLSPCERLLFISSFSHADDGGKLSASTAGLKKVTFGFDNYHLGQVRKWRDNIASKMSSYHIYEVGGKEYIALLRWHKYQRVDHPQPSTIPDPLDAVFDPPHSQNDSQNNSQNDSQNDSQTQSAAPAREKERKKVLEKKGKKEGPSTLHLANTDTQALIDRFMKGHSKNLNGDGEGKGAERKETNDRG
jgi:hypothetical protein